MVIFNKVCTQLVLEKRFNYILIYNYIHSIAYIYRLCIAQNYD